MHVKCIQVSSEQYVSNKVPYFSPLNKPNSSDKKPPTKRPVNVTVFDLREND